MKENTKYYSKLFFNAITSLFPLIFMIIILKTIWLPNSEFVLSLVLILSAIATTLLIIRNLKK